MTHTEQPRVTELVVFGPLDEADLDDELRMDPVGAQAREADGFGERRLFDLEAVELGAQVEQELCV